MGEDFTVADAYLFTVLGWARMIKLDLAPWPNVTAFQARVGAARRCSALKAEGLA